MKITIKKPVPNTHTPESYEVIITTVAGDGDDYVDITVGPFLKNKDDDALGYLFSLLTKMKKHQQANSYENFDNIEGFYAWFEDDYSPESTFFIMYPDYPHSYEKYLEDVAMASPFKKDSWPREAPVYDFHNGIDRIRIAYFDENKVEFETEFETEALFN